MKKNMIRRILGVAALMAFGACVASASTISYWVDVFSGTTTGALCSPSCPPSSGATLATGGGSNVSLTLPQFNQLGNGAEGTPAGGDMFTLTNVALALNWTATGNITVYNFFSSNIPFNNAQADTHMTLTAGSDSVATDGIAATGANTATCCNVINGTPIFLGQTVFNGLTGNGSTSSNPTDLGFYQGLGANNFSATIATNSVNVTGSSSDPHASSLAYQGNGQMGAIMTVTYTYAEIPIPVPEPVTGALAGAALLGLGLIKRFKRDRKA